MVQFDDLFYGYASLGDRLAASDCDGVARHGDGAPVAGKDNNVVDCGFVRSMCVRIAAGARNCNRGVHPW